MGNLCSGGTKKDDTKAPQTTAPNAPPTDVLAPPPISSSPTPDASAAPAPRASAAVAPTATATVAPIEQAVVTPTKVSEPIVAAVEPVVPKAVEVVEPVVEKPVEVPVAVVEPVVEKVVEPVVEVPVVAEPVVAVVEPVVAAVEEPKPEPIEEVKSPVVAVEEPKPVAEPVAVVEPVVEVPVVAEPVVVSTEHTEPTELGVYALPAKLHKYVIGQGGKVIKEISANNDVRLDLNGDENKLTITNKENDSTKITAAFEEVKKVLGEIGWFLENGEWVEKLAYDAIFREWSVKIDQEAAAMKKCFDESKQAFEAGNGEEAKNLSTQGKVHQENMHKYKKDCAQAVFDFLNAKYDDYTMDLHGQLVTEAMEFVVARVEKLTGNATQPLQIITGAGNHSDEKGAKIKPAVYKYLDEKSLKYEEVNNGTISVTL